MVNPSVIRIGTRKSALALAQAYIVRDLIAKAHPDYQQEGRLVIVPMSTTGDRRQDLQLSEIGGKGLFTKELEEGLFTGAVDIAVHSMKDMPTELPPGLMITAMPEREDPRDMLLSPHATRIADLPVNAAFGTSSLRRAAQLLHLRPDCSIVPFRGNVQTRLQKLREGQVAATMLASAGLKRLNDIPTEAHMLEVDEILPAVAQGAIGIECREADSALRDLLSTINHHHTSLAVECERALLATLDGSCRTPIAALATIAGHTLHLRAMLASPDGKECFTHAQEAALSDGLRLGQEVGNQLLAQRAAHR